jgi:hypothetical protein
MDSGVAQGSDIEAFKDPLDRRFGKADEITRVMIHKPPPARAHRWSSRASTKIGGPARSADEGIATHLSGRSKIRNAQAKYTCESRDDRRPHRSLPAALLGSGTNFDTVKGHDERS